MTDHSDLVLYEKRGDIAVMTINRPEKRNAVNRPAQTRIREILDDVAESGVKVLVITGVGDVSFCAGADLRDDSPAVLPTALHPTTWAQTQTALAQSPAVVIAAVNGYALGGGLTLVNNADLAIAADTATFGMPEINYGIYASLAGPSTVQRIAQKHVAQMVFTGERIDADRAERIGLVNEVVAADRVLERALELAEHIAGFDGLALDVAKHAIRDEQHMSWENAMLHGSWSTSFIAQSRPSA